MDTDDLNSSKVAIGILGGIGPEAGCRLNQLIIEQTQKVCSACRDQDHFECYHVSLPGEISDRTDFILGKTSENPAIGAFEAMKVLNEIGKIRDDIIYVGIPCNTFHAPVIMGELRDLMSVADLKHVELVDMVAETAHYIRDNLSQDKKIGLLATTGTIKAKVYNQYLDHYGFEIIAPDEFNQAKVHRAIYDQEWGVKAVSPVSLKAKDQFYKLILKLHEQGAQSVILGCTEISVAMPQKEIQGIKMIDPLRVLANRLVVKAHSFCKK